MRKAEELVHLTRRHQQLQTTRLPPLMTEQASSSSETRI